jgi:DNA repair protein RecN (Recombination protein N)
MLRELSVQNLALIADVRVELQPGFCAWTGETGAGKSLLLGAVGLLLGERGSSDLIRQGAEELRVAGVFEIEDAGNRQAVESVLDVKLDDDAIILSRRLTRGGRSHAYVNDQPVAVATLKRIGSLLVDLHGHRESESLLEPAYQLQLLDAFGELGKQRSRYLELAANVRTLRKRYNELSTAREQRRRDLALARFERDELDQAKLRPNELTELSQERERLANIQSLQAFAAEGYSALYEADDSVTDHLGRLHREALSWAKLDPALGQLASRLEGLRVEAEDAAQTLRQLSQRWEADPARLDEVEQRVQLLRRLETKYQCAIDELIVYRSKLDEQEARLQQQEDDLEVVDLDLSTIFTELKTAAVELSKQRQRVAKRLAIQTQKELADLGMAGARLDAVLEPAPIGDDPVLSEIPAWGAESLELTLAANPGEPALPLRKVASGGELSRTMLALKTVLATHDRLGTLIFDEIDANVGGRLGDVLGQKLAALGQTHQVICVTHLPQVASYARHHWTIRKTRAKNRTTTEIHALKDADRLEELASMLRGDARGETTRKEAAAMLDAARKRW